jgi:hypothetical protein
LQNVTSVEAMMLGNLSITDLAPLPCLRAEIAITRILISPLSGGAGV